MPPALDPRRSKQFIENFREKLERFEKYIENDLPNAKARHVQHRLTELGDSWLVYQRMLPPYELMDTELLTERVRTGIEESYINVVSELEDKLDELKEARRKLLIGDDKPGNQPITMFPTINAKLPTVALPTFSGGYLVWSTFIGTFNSLVHDNPSLSDRTKFQYLKLSLDGVAASAIAAVELTDENYDLARKILMERFNKPNFICEQHVHKLFEFKAIDRPDPKEIMRLLDHYQSHLRSLEALKRPIKQWDDLIVYVMVSKLDPDTKNRWNEAAPSTHLPTLDDLCQFLVSRAHRLESQTPNVRPPIPSNSRSKVASATRSTANSLAVTNNTKFHCVYCNINGHSIVRCHTFLKLPVDKRHRFVKESKLCYNCLHPDHIASACSGKFRCRHCDSYHHTLLHNFAVAPSSSSNTIEAASDVTQCKPNIQSTALAVSSSLVAAKPKPKTLPSFVYLGTALVKVLDHMGLPVVGRALLDSGSQLNLITKSFASILKIPHRNTSINIHGIGSNVVGALSSSTITLQSNITNYCAMLDVHIIPKITSYQPTIPIDSINSWTIPANIPLADPEFFDFQNVDLLLGAEIYQELLSVGQIKLADHLPMLQNTVLGWIVSGKMSSQSGCDYACHVTIQDSATLTDQIEKFWTIENYPHSVKQMSFEEAECEKHFEQFTKRNQEGRFIVKLPFSSDPTSLGDSKNLATRRFLNLERRLHKLPDLLANYSNFINEYKVLGHMELADPKEIALPNYYFPHHCVMKPESSSTKLRVVFDGSAKTSNGKSLNAIMMVGPVVQSDLFSVLTRFRSHTYAFSADIAKMYRQILVSNEDHKFQFILWRNSPSEPLQTFKLKTVTYGTSSAPHLATRCLKQLALDNKETYPIAANVIEKDFYIDDLLTGTNSIEAALELKRQISSILRSTGMELRKWCANGNEIIGDVPADDTEKCLKIGENELVKTLGIFWQPTSDEFKFFVNFNHDSIISKRAIFSQIARIYDPLGFLAPVVVLGKLLIQSLWQLKLDWDQSLPQHLHTYWEMYRHSLIDLNKFAIHRHLFCTSNPISIQIHGFADASERAYGAVLYVRSLDHNGHASVKLLCSKSRVAPLQKTTIPRLELCAALLLAKLSHKILENLNFNVDKIFYWSDSTITLHWIKSCPSRWNTFVSNRVSTIQELTSSESWLHVPTEWNPADLLSRGLMPDKFIESDLWIQGPAFLRQETSFWPTLREQFPVPEELCEARKTTSSNVVSNEAPNILRKIKYYNDFRKLKRIVAYLLRFKLTPGYKFSGPLKLQELDRAHITIIKIVQRESFPVEYTGLENPQFAVKQPALRSLSLFLDKVHVIRVGGRLRHTTLPYTSKHPILLHKAHDFTLTLITFYHRKLLHAGPKALQAAVRQYYWPIYGMSVCKKVFRECMECFRVRPVPMTQQMGDLPPERVVASPPFYSVGVDFAGPFYVHYRIRGKWPTKTYICLFICFVTKAIHLEFASDMSTQAFMGCFKRFVSTRGLCKRVFSDNGTNFIGANSELRELYALLSSQDLNNQLQTMCEDDRIE